MRSIQQPRAGAPGAAAVHRRAKSELTTVYVRRRMAGDAMDLQAADKCAGRSYCTQVDDKPYDTGASEEEDGGLMQQTQQLWASAPGHLLNDKRATSKSMLVHVRTVS